jgi:hypothetical protein
MNSRLFVFVEPHITSFAFNRLAFSHGFSCHPLDVDNGIDSDRGGTTLLNVDDVGLNIVDNGVGNQPLGVWIVARWWRKEARNVGLQPLYRPAREGTLKEAPQEDMGNVLLGEFGLFHHTKNG